MLASVGATSKQIRKSVLFEAFIIGLIGIPLGIILRHSSDSHINNDIKRFT